MKMKITIVLIVLLLWFAPIFADSFRLFVKGGVLISGDSTFSDLYGTAFLPQIKGEIFILKGFYLFGGYAFTQVKGTLPDLLSDSDVKAKQGFLSFGAGLTTGKKLQFYLEGGIVMANWEETAFDTSSSGDSTGFHIEGGLNLKLGDSFLLNFNLGYLSAEDTSEESGTSIPLTLGGLKSGIGIGIGF